MGWEEIVLKLSTSQITFEQAFQASGFKTAKEFTFKLIQTAGNNKGKDIGKAADSAVKALQAQLRLHQSLTIKGKVVKKGAENVARKTMQNKVVQKGAENVARNTIKGKVIQKTAENVGKTTIKGKVVQSGGKQVIKKLGGRLAINVGTKVVGRSIGIKIVAGLTVGIVGVAIVAGSFLLDIRDVYNAVKPDDAQEEVSQASDSAPEARYKIYKKFDINDDDWGLMAIYIGDIEFDVDENGKISGRYKKTIKGGGLAVAGNKKPDIIKDYTISGHFDYRETGTEADEKNKAGKEIDLEIKGFTTEKEAPNDLFTHDVEIEADGYFNGNNFVFDMFKVSMRVNPDRRKTTYWASKEVGSGYYKTPSGQVSKKSFQWSTDVLEGWTAVKVEDFERNEAREVQK